MSLPGRSVTAVVPPLAHALRDRYVLERELGRGGMATVYLARDLRHDRLVALKVLHPELAHALGPRALPPRDPSSPPACSIRTSCRCIDSGETAGRLWYTMPYVEGESLRDRLRRERAAPAGRRAADRTRQVARRARIRPPRRASSIATSSRRTSCSRGRAMRWSPTSASPGRVDGRAASG